MKNLAGNAQCDTDIVNELLAAGIQIVSQERSLAEVPAAFRGKLNGWDFNRVWSYWVAYPMHPNRGLDIDKARKLYVEHGQKARAGGDCACRPPEVWARFYQKASNKQIVIDPRGEQLASFNQFKLPTDDLVFVSFLDHAGPYQQVVDLYHIDTQEALNAFVEAIR